MSRAKKRAATKWAKRPKRTESATLTPLEQRFVDEYPIDLNGAQAATRAGYSARSARIKASELLKRPRVAAAIAAALATRSERTAVTQDYVLTNLVEVVERCMQRSPVMVRQGRELVQLVDDDERHVWQFDARGANGALGLLGKHLKMFTDVVKHEGLEALGEAMRLAEQRLANQVPAPIVATSTVRWSPAAMCPESSCLNLAQCRAALKCLNRTVAVT